ncbi:MAG: acetyl-CoA carboxylase biotin carboxyl carrier protein [Treponema sp.]|jgi:acetyl-CoA carboxylase biotin carboxyl carrier protein|nr:acetyl-CoA carboxylase biotin carboxyl carrier protein [Treponema sp.]
MTEKFILTLIDKFAAADMAELQFDDGGASLSLRKEGAFVRAAGLPPGFVPQASAPAEFPPARGDGVSAAGLPDAGVRLGLPVGPVGSADSGVENITSPIVATFYAAPGPDSPPFVKAGSEVKAGDTLCILEAMKMMNHLEAEFDCRILSVKAAPGDLVEYGQILFEVKRI